MSTFHLKGLNSYRAIAAIVVIIGHIEIFKLNNGFDNALNLPFFKFTGQHVGVVLFFALSGFLITMLLLREKDTYQSISLKSFYLRRIFRVWPLYYMILLLSYLLLDYSPSRNTTLLCLTIFPNIAHALNMGWAASPQVWSIGVEEQFYIGWPLIVKNTKRLLIVFVGIFFFFTFLPHVLTPILNKLHADAIIVSSISSIFYGTKFNCMAAGGIFALLYHKKYKIVNWLNYNQLVAYVFIILPFTLWIAGYHIPFFTDELYSVLFSISILNVSTNPKVVNIDYKISNYLGKISYGIYMYHWIILELLFKANFLKTESSILSNILIYGTTLSITIIVASLSYKFIERPLLNWKEKYSRA